ncbi:MAG: FeoB-associated Cys-rich membrane protein [Candidatus Hydrogenedentes bacterium]|nr:FeoB-associated Cys-rich membrane protein [Candidatus Hydrogenedentota bacterium]
MSLEAIIVALIVGGCVFYFVRRLYRTFAGKAGGSCSCSDCPAKSPTDNAAQHHP